MALRLIDNVKADLVGALVQALPMALFFGPIVGGYVLAGAAGGAAGLVVGVALMVKPLWRWLFRNHWNPLLERVFGGCGLCDDITTGSSSALGGFARSGGNLVLPESVMRDLAGGPPRS